MPIVLEYSIYAIYLFFAIRWVLRQWRLDRQEWNRMIEETRYPEHLRCR
jgi:hypothetical protein